MIDHLPECYQYEHSRNHFDDYWCDSDCDADCICDRLRECEERVLEAAMEAVEEVPQWYSDLTKDENGSVAAECLVEDVIAAINVLKPNADTERNVSDDRH